MPVLLLHHLPRSCWWTVRLTVSVRACVSQSMELLTCPLKQKENYVTATVASPVHNSLRKIIIKMHSTNKSSSDLNSLRHALAKNEYRILEMFFCSPNDGLFLFKWIESNWVMTDSVSTDALHEINIRTFRVLVMRRQSDETFEYINDKPVRAHEKANKKRTRSAKMYWISTVSVIDSCICHALRWTAFIHPSHSHQMHDTNAIERYVPFPSTWREYANLQSLGGNTCAGTLLMQVARKTRKGNVFYFSLENV